MYLLLLLGSPLMMVGGYLISTRFVGSGLGVSAHGSGRESGDVGNSYRSKPTGQTGWAYDSENANTGTEEMFGPDPLNAKMVWVPDEIAHQLVADPFAIDPEGEISLTDYFIDTFGLSEDEERFLRDAIDLALTEIRRLDLEKMKVLHQSAEETIISIKGYAAEGTELRERFVASLGHVFGQKSADLFFRIFGHQMDRFTFKWGAVDRTFTYRPMDNGNVEIIAVIGGVRSRSVGTGPSPEFRHLVNIERNNNPNNLRIPDPFK